VSAHAESGDRTEAEDRDLTGDVAVITGGGSPVGIGAATGRLLAEHGCRVVLSDVNAATLDATVASLRAEGLDVTGIVADVSELASMRALADQVFTAYGHVDIAFLNAGIGYPGSYLDDDIDCWHQVYGVNLFGVLHGIKAFVPRMVAQGTPGDVLGTTSGSGAVGVMYQTPAYSSSKAAVLTLMEGLYATLRDQNSVIRVHAVFPPLTRTNLGGDPSVMAMVQRGLESNGIAAVLAEPEEVAVTVLESIQIGNFWAHHDHGADWRLSSGRFKADIDWQDEIVRKRAAAIITRTAPDPYLWGLA
jgi:NAD(P)-dependent dehydrogenase (short-subunit alcohol dehydrogenase family)